MRAREGTRKIQSAETRCGEPVIKFATVNQVRASRSMPEPGTTVAAKEGARWCERDERETMWERSARCRKGTAGPRSIKHRTNRPIERGRKRHLNLFIGDDGRDNDCVREKQMSWRGERARKARRKGPSLLDLFDNDALPAPFHWSNRPIVCFARVCVGGCVCDACLTVFVVEPRPPLLRGTLIPAPGISEVAVITSNRGGQVVRTKTATRRDTRVVLPARELCVISSINRGIVSRRLNLGRGDATGARGHGGSLSQLEDK